MSIYGYSKKYNVVDSFQGLKTIKELKTFLPEMEHKLFRHLKADIKRNGMNDPILCIRTSSGHQLVIEGHTRLRAALELKLKYFPTKEISNDFKDLDDIKLWMIEHQFQRRNLSSVEKLTISFKSKETIERRAKENLMKAGKSAPVNEKIDTNSEIAKIAGVSRSTAVRYNNVIKNASEKVKQKMLKGELSISGASKTIKESHKKQQRISPENKTPEIQPLMTYEEGIESLSKGKIEALVTLKDRKQIDAFNSRQIGKFGFYVLQSQSHETSDKRSLGGYEELVSYGK
ncbi:chromosome partitioning protein, ParB family [Draconibacterium orientale]|uniref:Chromosome partitioning protein, ParB family n=1 Tax=Draconibacterium orientale TaxID=1168034 RepID=X5DH65_9BACT|nr:ParB/RepB/Spo0J family partition protein [Draconibacterium orientale]AHW62328.1 hypothetical protein FH5T_19790 [Draconibacterium orientale]SEU15742.1 chromosome partitioning protein, ParB family [Draconibacterium orientale]